MNRKLIYAKQILFARLSKAKWSNRSHKNTFNLLADCWLFSWRGLSIEPLQLRDLLNTRRFLRAGNNRGVEIWTRTEGFISLPGTCSKWYWTFSIDVLTNTTWMLFIVDNKKKILYILNFETISKNRQKLLKVLTQLSSSESVTLVDDVTSSVTFRGTVSDVESNSPCRREGIERMTVDDFGLTSDLCRQYVYVYNCWPWWKCSSRHKTLRTTCFWRKNNFAKTFFNKPAKFCEIESIWVFPRSALRTTGCPSRRGDMLLRRTTCH